MPVSLQVSRWPDQWTYVVSSERGRQLARLDIKGDPLHGDETVELDVAARGARYFLEGWLEGQGAIRWWSATRNRRLVDVEAAVDAVGSVIDRFVEILARDLPPLEGGASYTLPEWP